MADIFGTSLNDTLEGTADQDLIEAVAGDDVIRGNAGDDTILGGTGNDDIFGGDGDDSIDGGAGNDIMTGGAGDDTLSGGEGRDQFYGLNYGDVINGGEGGEDFDRIFLDGATPPGGRYEINADPTNSENGTIVFFDADDVALGQITYTNIEKIDPDIKTPPCFTPGTRIATPKGERFVEDLRVGDRVITRDNGLQTIRWAGRRDMSGKELAHAPHLWPVLIQQGALGEGLPERDMMVSPNHRMLVANDKTALYFEEREVLVAAKHLTGLKGVDIVEVSDTAYIHIMFDQHEVILSDGTWTESFQPGDTSLAGVGNAQRLEILEVFPELATPEGAEVFGSARRTLKRHEAKLLVD